MKKITLIAAAAALFGFSNSNAQTHDVSLNLAPMVLGNYSARYAFNFAEEMSAGMVVGFQNLKLDDGIDTYTYKGFYLAPEFRYYFNPDEGNDGFFAGGYLKYRSMGTSGEPYLGYLADGTDVVYDQKNNGLALGVVTGKVWQSRKGFNFSIWSGLGYYLFDKTTYTNDYNPSEDPIIIEVSDNLPSLDFRFGLSVGYRIGG